MIDFRRDKLDIPAKVQAIEYDPNRSANIALLAYADGEKRYILAPRGVKAGDSLLSTNEKVEFSAGYSFPLALIPPATKIHAIELHPGRGAQLVRSAGQAAQLINVDGDRVTVKLPSGEIRYLNARCRATIGEVGNHEHEGRSLGKAGRNRWLGRRPRVRGVAMNRSITQWVVVKVAPLVGVTRNHLGVNSLKDSRPVRNPTQLIHKFLCVVTVAQ